MRILAVDPGTAATGYGVVDYAQGKVSAETFGCITTPAGMPAPRRLREIFSTLTMLIDTYEPDYLVAEQLFFNANVRTAMAVGQARGVTLLAAAVKEIPFCEYTPLEVKMAVAGYGRASKAQVQAMVKTVLRLESVPEPDDAADALAVAICHAHSAKMRRVMGGSRG